MKEISTAQVSCIMAMINKLKLKAQKEHIIMGATDGRTTSTRELTSDEANALIKYLKSQDPDEIGAEKMRRKIISMAHEMGWKLPNSKADMERVDNWCVKYGFLHKKLNQYLYNELPKLVTQFESVYQSFLKTL
jgi:hypothetical protein